MLKIPARRNLELAANLSKKVLLSMILFICFSNILFAEHLASSKLSNSNKHCVAVPIESKTCLRWTELNKDSNIPFFFNFNGKGIFGPWDLGIAKAVLEEKLIQGKKNIVWGGNSSGSLLAAYFACWGMNQQTIDDALKILSNKDGGEEFDFSNINFSSAKKILRLLREIKTENPHEDILPLIEKILQKNGKKCELTEEQSLIIGAANLDLIDARVLNEKSGGPSISEFDAKGKAYDPASNEVRREGIVLGKACTQFVSPTLFRELQKIPYERRECELRIIQSYEDIKLAVLASVAEPTYFEPVKESSPEKVLRSGGLAALKERIYTGGFLNPINSIDLKNLNSRFFVLSTGRANFSEKQESMVRNWYMVSPNQRAAAGRISLDMEIKPEKDFDWDHPEDAGILFEKGYLRAKQIFRSCSK